MARTPPAANAATISIVLSADGPRMTAIRPSSFSCCNVAVLSIVLSMLDDAITGRPALQHGQTIGQSQRPHRGSRAVGVRAHVRRGDDLRQGQQRVVAARRLLSKGVQRRAGEMAAL